MAAVVWDGPNLTFTKAAFADWTLQPNQDRMTGDIWITRKNAQGIFNIEQEPAGYVHNVSPAGTVWATGSLSNWQALTYTDWESWTGSNPPGTIGQLAVVHLVADDVYLQIKFLSWGSGTAGGGSFSYQRSTPLPAFDWKGGNSASPTDWGVAANWSPSTGVPDGPGALANFGNQPATANLVDMTSIGRTAGNITFAATTGTTIQSTGGFSLTLDNAGGFSTIDVAGNDVISAPVVLNNDAIIEGPGTLDLSGGIRGNHAVTVLGNLAAASIQVDALIVGGTGVVQTVPEPSALSFVLAAAASGLTFFVVVGRYSTT